MTGGFQRCFSSFLRASGGPFLYLILYHKPAEKYRGKAKYKNTRTQEPRNPGMGKIEIRNKFKMGIISEIRNKNGFLPPSTQRKMRDGGN